MDAKLLLYNRFADRQQKKRGKAQAAFPLFFPTIFSISYDNMDEIAVRPAFQEYLDFL